MIVLQILVASLAIVLGGICISLLVAALIDVVEMISSIHDWVQEQREKEKGGQ